MNFAQPEVLAVGVLLLIAFTAFLHRADARRIADLARFATHSGSPTRRVESAAMRSGQRRRLGLGAALALLALAGPQVGSDWQETKRRGIDVLFALDVSRSMLAADVAPNRLARARLAILDFTEQLGGDRVGLIAFAGAAFLQAPLTLDHAAFNRTLATTTPAVIPRPGTDLASALEAAARALESKKGNAKILVLLSDGEDLSGAAASAARQAAEAGIRVFTVGVGSRDGELIQITDADGRPAYLKDEKGNLVRSSLDEAMLTQIAETTGGFYVPLGRHGEGMARIREEVLERIPKEELASRMRQKPRNRYQWPLAGALLCLLAELLRQSRGAASAAAALLLIIAAPPALAAEVTGQAHYEAGRWPEAARAFRLEDGGELPTPPTSFAIGAARYRAGEYAPASRAFEAALRSSDPQLRAHALYNLGNALFREGEGSLGEEPQKTLADWQRALDAYAGALKLGPDEDTSKNHELVAHAREQLERRLAEEPPPEPESKPEKSPSPKPPPSPSANEEQDPSDGNPDESDASEPQDERGKDGKNGEEGEDTSEREPTDGDDDSSSPQDQGNDPSSSPANPSGAGTRETDEAEKPGRMAPAEARALLDSLEGEERRLAIPLAEGEEEERSGQGKVQDW
jgi:Ca-activated chloride channel family protein